MHQTSLPISDLEEILARGSHLWDSLRSASIFMTGGTGFFGRWLLEGLRYVNEYHNLDLKVTVLSRQPDPFVESAPHLANYHSFDFVCGDIRSYKYPTCDITHIIHAATTSAHETFNGENPLNKFNLLVDGTRHTLNLALERDVKNILFTSSGVVYGGGQERLGEPAGIFETNLVAPSLSDPASALGQAKRAAEFLCTLHADEYKVNVNIARCFSFVGPLLPLGLHYAIGNFIRSAIDNTQITVKSDGLSVRSYMYPSDLVVWLLTMLLENKGNQVFNVGSDDPVSIKDLAFRVRDLVSPNLKVTIKGNAAQARDNHRRDFYVPDINRAKDQLGLDVWTNLDGAIIKTADYYTASR